MFDLDKWQEIYHVLRSNKLRTFLTAFGVFWGIFMLVIMLGSGTGLRNGITNFSKDLATNSAVFWGQSTTISYNGLQRGRRITFDNNDIKAIKEKVPGIKVLVPRAEVMTWRNGDSANIVVRNNKKSVFTINADVPDIKYFSSVNIESGRFINEIDVRENRKVVAIGRRAKEALFEKDEDPIGQYIKIGSIYYKVVGVLKPTNDRSENQVVSIPLTTMQKAYNMGNKIDRFFVVAEDNIPVGELEPKVMEILKQRHNISPQDDQAFGHFNIYDQFKKVTNLFTGIGILIWIVGIGTLLSGVIGVSNIMLIVIKERTKEIGIRRALGARPRKIINQIITESLFLTIISGVFGMSFGVMILEAMNKATMNASYESPFRNPGVDFNIAVAALIILIIAGILAGLYPAKKAIEVKPIDALRYE